MKKTLSLILLLVMGLLASPVFAQTTLNSTTLSSALTTPSPSSAAASNLVTLASLGSGSTAVLVGNLLFVDGEAMQVRLLPASGTTVTVIRATNSTRAQTHASGAIVYYGPPTAFVQGTPGIPYKEGTCTASNLLYAPIVDILNATIGDCQDSTWRWFRLAPLTTNTVVRHPVVDKAYTALVTDYIIAYNSLTAGRAVTLPSPTGLNGKVFIIKDESGSATTASTKTITIVGTVDGSANPTAINSAYGVYRIYSDGSNWFTW